MSTQKSGKPTTFSSLKKELLNDPEIKAEYDRLTLEEQIRDAVIKFRKENSMTQTRLAKELGVSQAEVSKIEGGTANSTIATITRLAAAMNSNVTIEFAPKNE